MRLANELTPSSPILRNQTFLSILRHWLSSSSTGSSHFTRLSVFANSHLVHDLRCKTRKPTEQWTVIGDTHTCVFSGNSKSSTWSFHFSHSHFNTTVGHVITLGWSLQNHFHSCTCMNHRILECFRARFIMAFLNDSAKTKIFHETNKK